MLSLSGFFGGELGSRMREGTWHGREWRVCKGKCHLVWQELSAMRTTVSHCGELCGTYKMRGTLRGLK